MSTQQSCLMRDLVELMDDLGELVDKHRATHDLMEIYSALEVIKACYIAALMEQLDAGLNNEEQADG